MHLQPPRLATPSLVVCKAPLNIVLGGLMGSHRVLSVYASTAMIALVGVLHYLLSRVANQFDDVFAGFGAELPVLTQIVYGGSTYYWLVPGLVIAITLLNAAKIIPKSTVVAISGLLSIGSIFLCIIGLYLPIFQLGAVTS